MPKVWHGEKMKSVPPRGSGWVRSNFSTMDSSGTRLRTHPLPRGDTDLIPLKKRDIYHAPFNHSRSLNATLPVALDPLHPGRRS